MKNLSRNPKIATENTFILLIFKSSKEKNKTKLLLSKYNEQRKRMRI